MTDQEVAEKLREARELLKRPGAWTQHAYARSKLGRPIGPVSEGAVQWCVLGACQRVSGGYTAAYARLFSAMDGNHAVARNDSADDLAEALTIFDEAIAKLGFKP